MTKKCSFGFLSPCSTSAEENSLFQIRACLKSTRNHLRNLNCEFDRDIPEGLLILYRSGLYSVDSSVLKYFICEKHRDELGTHWRRSQRTCQAPSHPNHSAAKVERGFQAAVCKQLWMSQRRIIPVGAGSY